MTYYGVPSLSDEPSTRPFAEEYLPYYCSRTQKIRIDRLPVTLEEVRECQQLLACMYASTRQGAAQ